MKAFFDRKDEGKREVAFDSMIHLCDWLLTKSVECSVGDDAIKVVGSDGPESYANSQVHAATTVGRHCLDSCQDVSSL